MGLGRDGTTAKLTFLDTRGEIDIRSRRHALVQSGDARIMIDCGKDWLGRLRYVAPTAIVLTHAHADHAGGFAKGAPCPIYATRTTWASLSRFPIADRREIPAGTDLKFGGAIFRACPVQHSIRAPAVGYRINLDSFCLFYVPDVAWLPNAARALRRVDIYIGDGATIKRSMIRRKGRAFTGHAPIVAQLGWCERAGIKRAIFTHCGSQIVRGDAHRLAALIHQLGREHGIDAQFAYDGGHLSFLL